MQNNNTTILVPWDFTVLCEYALQHAIGMAKISNQNILLVHILEKGKNVEEIETRLKSIAKKASDSSDIHISVAVRKGNMFKNLRQMATNEIDTSLVMMKTGGPIGRQKYTGSRAIKIISGAQIPFLVIQGPPSLKKVERIVVSPIDFRYENKEKIKWIQFLAKYYKLKIHMVRPETRDAGFKRNISNNIMFTKQQLEKKGIEYTITTISSEKPFHEEVMNLAHEKKADLMLVMFKKHIGLFDYLMGLKEQYYLTNSYKIPVMCVNPNINLRKFQSFN